jgi:hypothetical protein
MTRRVLFIRHGIKNPKTADDHMSEDYPGITEKGAKMIKDNTAEELFHAIEESPENSIFVLGGVSDEVRTASTSRAAFDELKKKLADNSNYLVVTEQDIWGEERKSDRDDSLIYHGNDFMTKLKGIVDGNPDKKIIIAAPKFVKEFSLKRRGWLNPDSTKTQYNLMLSKKSGGNETDVFKYWVDNQGPDIKTFYGKKLSGAKPLEVAKDYEKGIERLEKFIGRYINTSNRPVIIGITSHCFDMDAFLTYAVGGNVNIGLYNLISKTGPVIKEGEIASLTTQPDGGVTLNYRGQEISRKPKKLENMLGAIALIGILGTLLSTSGITGNVVGASYNSPMGVFFVFVFLIAVMTFVATKMSKE